MSVHSHQMFWTRLFKVKVCLKLYDIIMIMWELSKKNPSEHGNYLTHILSLVEILRRLTTDFVVVYFQTHPDNRRSLLLSIPNYVKSLLDKTSCHHHDTRSTYYLSEKDWLLNLDDSKREYILNTSRVKSLQLRVSHWSKIMAIYEEAAASLG